MLIHPFAGTTEWWLAISGLQLWCEDGKNFDVDGCYSWDNECGSGETVTQATGSLKPDEDTDRFGSGRDGILWDDTDDLMDISGIALTGAFSLYFVLYRNSTALEPLLTSTVGVGTGLYISAATTNKLRFDPGAAADFDLSTNNILTNGQRKLIDVHRDSSDNWTVYVNGADVTSGTPNDSTTVNCNRLGKGFGHTSALSYGVIAIYDAELSSSQKSGIRTYIQSRWTVD